MSSGEEIGSAPVLLDDNFIDCCDEFNSNIATQYYISNEFKVNPHDFITKAYGNIDQLAYEILSTYVSRYTLPMDIKLFSKLKLECDQSEIIFAQNIWNDKDFQDTPVMYMIRNSQHADSTAYDIMYDYSIERLDRRLPLPQEIYDQLSTYTAKNYAFDVWFDDKFQRSPKVYMKEWKSKKQPYKFPDNLCYDIFFKYLTKHAWKIGTPMPINLQVALM